MIKKILFLTSVSLTQNYFKQFGIELLLENGFEVEVWDCRNVLCLALAEKYTPPDMVKWEGCKVIDDREHLVNQLESLDSNVFVFPFCYHDLRSCFIYKAISASRAEYGYPLIAGLPPPGLNSEMGRVLYKKFKKLQKRPWKELIDYGFYRFPFRWLGIKPLRLIIAGGSESVSQQRVPCGDSTEILWAHTWDYDRYLEVKDKQFNFGKRPIAVFIDQYVPFHPDCFYQGLKIPITADKYYFWLNKFFRLVESQLGLQVVIAAHPKSCYEDHPDYFEGRMCIRGRTAELIKESRLVLTHDSTAFNIAILFYKPVIFLTSSDIEKSEDGIHIGIISNWFGRKPVFADSATGIDWDLELTVNKSQYDNYRRAYIKTDHSEDLPFWQIVANRLKRGI